MQTFANTKLVQKITFFRYFNDKSRHPQTVSCYMSQSVTIWLEVNVAPYFGCETGTYPWSDTSI